MTGCLFHFVLYDGLFIWGFYVVWQELCCTVVDCIAGCFLEKGWMVGLSVFEADRKAVKFVEAYASRLEHVFSPCSLCR